MTLTPAETTTVGVLVGSEFGEWRVGFHRDTRARSRECFGRAGLERETYIAIANDFCFLTTIVIQLITKNNFKYINNAPIR